MIIIDIDWYEKNYCDNFFGHIAQPYVYVLFISYKMHLSYAAVKRFIEV